MEPRITPVDPPYTDEVADQLRRMMPPGVQPIGLFRTFVRHLPMARAMGGWGSYELGRELSLDRRARELVIDRTCARCGCEYEWGVHVAFFAERIGLTAEQITSLTYGSPDDVCWTEPIDRVLLEAADALHDSAALDDELYGRMRDLLTEQQVLDLLLLCGWYHAISFAANGARVALEPWAPRFADVRPQSAGQVGVDP